MGSPSVWCWTVCHIMWKGLFRDRRINLTVLKVHRIRRACWQNVSLQRKVTTLYFFLRKTAFFSKMKRTLWFRAKYIMNCWSESRQENLMASVSLSLSPRKRQLEDSEVFERMKSFKLSRSKRRCAFTTLVCVALGSITNKACNLCICSLVLLICEVFPLRNDRAGNSCLFLSYLTPMFALRTSWDLSFFFFFCLDGQRQSCAYITLPCTHTQSKTASGFRNNYLNLPPIVMLDHKPGLLHGQADALFFLVPDASFWATPSHREVSQTSDRFSFHRFRSAVCAVIILTTHKWLLPAAITRIRTLGMRSCPDARTQLNQR